MTNHICHSRASGNPERIWMPAFAGMTRIFLILAVFFWGLTPQSGLFAAQSDSFTVKVKVIDSAPVGSITINNDEQYTGSTQVTLGLSAHDNEGNLASMQFSNDGSTWSAPEPYAATKIWELPAGDGKKTVYARFIDQSGHVSEDCSDSIFLYSGIVIDPATGGEVLSPDGRIRLIIPPESIPIERGPTSISLILLDSASFENSAPQDYKLRIIFDCKPAGLFFYKNVKYPQFKEWPQLLITLGQSEVPGTPIELGLFNEITNKIELAEEPTAPVWQDGTTVEFLIKHFSTYAGLASMLSQGAPIGAGVKIPLPDMLTGAFGHSIPITVPPGRKGMQPNLSLQYRSSNGNSWCGFGWSLNPGYIVRSTKLGPPKYTDEDTFIFVTDSGSTEMVHLIDNLYQAKIESSFARFYKEADDSWKVAQKDGSVLRFGQSADSKETAGGGTFLWNLTNVTDTNGNYIDITYIKDQGKSYLKYIDYTGPSPKNRVEFILEDREDKYTSFISGSEIKTAKRLKEIEITQQNDLVWRYELIYEYSPGAKRSLLKSVTQYTSDGQACPSSTFKYQKN